MITLSILILLLAIITAYMLIWKTQELSLLYAIAYIVVIGATIATIEYFSSDYKPP